MKQNFMWVLVLVGATCLGVQAEIVRTATKPVAADILTPSTTVATPDEPRKPTGSITGVDEF